MTVLSVSQVNTYIKAILDEIPPIQNIYVSGEISNFKHYYQSGHMYFTLKDERSQLKAVMFSSDNYKLRFRPENGMKVICFGQVGVYERDGVYQLYVRDIQPKGTGELQIAYEQLKSKLENEGLFDELHKKPIPKYPSRIGVATSNMGAAVEDIKNVISRRYPLCEIVIVPTVVQGDAAGPDIVRSVKMLDSMNVDTIILGRGGGSIEDLWAFNTEEVARAVFNCRTPVISAVGHETDYTICDFVADMRAPTPSAAAELAVPNIANELVNLQNYAGALDRLINYRITDEQNRLDTISKNSPLSDISKFFEGIENGLDDRYNKLCSLFSDTVSKKDLQLQKSAATLNALSPMAVLGRGYAMVTNDRGLITSVDSVKPDEKITIKVCDGSINAKITEVFHGG